MRPSMTLCCLLLLFAAFAADAQRDRVAVPSLGERIEVSIVNVDVVVTDRRGARVTGLTANDFEILVDGKAQPITHFAEYGSAVAAESIEASQTPAADAPPHRPRTILLFIDERALAGRKGRVFDQLQEFVRSAVRPGDSAAVVSWLGRSILRQGYTDDVGELSRALDRVAERLPPTSDFVWAQPLEEQAYFEILQDELARAGWSRSQVADGVSGTQLEAAERAYAEMKRKVAGLKALISTMGAGDSQKVLVLVTDRFSRYAGLEFLQSPRIPIGPPGGRIRQYDMRRYLEELSRHANAHGITIHGLFPQGADPQFASASLGADSVPGIGDAAFSVNSEAIAFYEMDALNLVAERTGGRADLGGAVADLLPQIAGDLDNYYSLAYRSTDGAEDRARKIVVRTKDRSLQVRSRRESVSRSDETKMKDRVLAHLFRPDEGGSTIRLRAHLSERRDAGKGKSLVPLRIEIPVADLLPLPDGKQYAGSFSVYLATAGPLGSEGSITERRQPFTISAEKIEEAKESTFSYDVELLVDRLTDRVAVAVLDEVSRGYGLLLVRVPAQNALLDLR